MKSLQSEFKTISTSEKLLLGCFFLFYFGIGFLFAHKTTLVYHPKYIHDLYLGFDNTLHNTSFVRHPLLKIIAIFINTVFSFLKDKSYLIILICSTLFSFHLLIIFRYLKNIIGLSSINSVLVLALYSVFSTCLILSFTFESYVFSLFFLSFYIYVTSWFRRRKETVPNSVFYGSAILVGGITVTNVVKVFAGIFDADKKVILKRIAVLIIFSVIIFLLFRNQIIQSLQHTSNYIAKSDDFLRESFYYFFGGQILFPDLVIVDIDYENLGLIKTVSAIFPKGILKTLVIFNFLILMLISLIVNRKNRNVQMIFLMFLVDIVIHLIVKLGINEAYIFGGNFIFIIPLLLGFLVKSVSQKFRKVLIINILTLIPIVFFLNFSELKFLFEFGQNFYSK